MPLQTQNPFGMGIREPDWSNVSNLFQNYAKGYEAGQTPQKMAAERLKESLTNTGLQQQNEYNPRRWEEEMALSRAHQGAYNAQAKHYGDQAVGRTFAPSAIGKLIQERDDLAAKNPNSPLLAEYDRAIKAQGGGRKFAPTGLGKLYTEMQEVNEGFLPGSNGEIPLNAVEQEELRNRYKLQIQKTSSDQATRTTVLRGQNLLQSIDASNIDDLTRYSGLKGSGKLKIEQAKDLAGNPSEEYLKYLEATQAAKLEAKELRQFFGDSITPDVQDALYKMTNATSLTKSPEAAQRMILKSRDIIKKQVETFNKALKSTDTYSESSPRDQQVNEVKDQLMGAYNQQQDMITIRNPKTGETKQISRTEYEARKKK